MPDTGPAMLPVTRELLETLGAWGASDRRRMFRAWHRGSLSLIHLQVLSILEAEGAVSMSRLADELDVSVASATGIVDRMQQRHLVVRRHDPDDRRLVLVSCTDAGGKVFHAMADHRRTHLEALVGRLSEDEAAGLLIGLRGIQRARRMLEETDRGDGPDAGAAAAGAAAGGEPAAGAPSGGAPAAEASARSHGTAGSPDEQGAS
jgi:4'-phosphopantetheinyl transferase